MIWKKEYKSCGTCSFFDCGMETICKKCKFHNIENDFSGNCFNCKHKDKDIMDIPCVDCNHLGNDDNQDMWDAEDPYGLCETCKHQDGDMDEYPCGVCGHLQDSIVNFWEAI